MMITSKEIEANCGVLNSWVNTKLRHLAKDYVVNRYSQYNVTDLLKYATNYKSTSRNPRQRDKSIAMMMKLQKYLEGLKDEYSRNV